MALLNSVTVLLCLPLVFPLGLYPGLGMEVVNGSWVLLVIILIQVVIWVVGSGLPRRHVQVHLLRSFRIQGTQRRGDGNDCASLPPKEWEVRWTSLAILFLDLGLGEVCTGDAWNLPSEATGVGLLPAGQSSRRGWRTGAGPILISCTRA